MDPDLKIRITDAYSSAEQDATSSRGLIQLAEECLANNPDQGTMHEFLDLAHLTTVSKIISESGNTDKWLDHIVNIIKRSRFHVGYMLRQRANRYKDKTAFNILIDNKLKTLSFSTVWSSVIETGRALSVFQKNEDIPVIGLLTHNQLSSVLVDLACLSFGVRVIPLPLNSTPEHISFILDHAEITHLFVGGKTGTRLWNEVQHKHPVTVISLNDTDRLKENTTGWDHFLEQGDPVQDFDPDSCLSNVQMESVQTIMYTSGTTANPKGIVFNPVNMMSKRFARALALPEIGSHDVFLCYLPLFHTFGRYFELMGSIFWGATYSFAESPAFNSLLNDFKIVQPTIFISIPKRWVQLYEMLNTELELDSDDASKIKSKLNEITGGHLKWGLSAAGYLDPDIFSLFQTHGINLLSGYGMTEATGGITMNPPDNYEKDSVGKALPGIDLKLADDGELCLKGPYVTAGYYKEENSEVFTDGWFHTEDIFEERNGHFFIVDRKKDIYKNSRGQTIAPQKIENLFQDFDSVKSVYLVGDGREFNTVLIYPDYENSPVDLKRMDEQGIRDIFGSMILSVNSFLSSFERIVNYVIIHRDFSAEKGELTPKGTFKRKNVLKNFKDIIDPLYEKNYVSLYSGSKEIRIPNWFLREKGTVRTNLRWDGNTLSITEQSVTLSLSWSDSKVTMGDYTYVIETDILDIESLIQSPTLWLGNSGFTDFTGPSVFRLKESEPYDSLKIDELQSGTTFNKATVDEKMDTLLYKLHWAVRQFLSDDPGVFKPLSTLVDGDLGNWSGTIIDTFMNYQSHSNPHFRIKMIEALAPLLSGDFLVSMIHSAYLYQRRKDKAKGFSFDITRTNDDHYQALIHYLQEVHQDIGNADGDEQEFVKTLLLLVSDFGTIHPTRFLWARSELIGWQLSDIPKPLYSTAQKAYYALIKGFRSWIGKSASLTVDPESGEEYSWKDVVNFDENVRQGHQKRLMESINETSMIRESIFLFSKNYIVGLNDIPKGGIWITHLGTRNNKSVFRILLRTRSFGTHNLVVNLNEGWDREFLDEETKWLITMGSGFKDTPLVENFGGYWPEHQLYTEEYIQGETLATYLKRNKKDIRDEAKVDRWQMRWLHFIWNGIQAYQEFWNRTYFKLSIQPPAPENLIIPQHDYKTGTRLISISGRKPIVSIAEHFLSLYTDYIVQTEQKYPGLNHMSDWEVIFTATLQAVKVTQGKDILEQLKLELDSKPIKKKCKSTGLTIERINQFLNDIDKFGLLTKPVVFASLRYERWLDLNPEATLQARASILQELYADYDLDSLLDEYPETRVRFFMMTCFKENNADLLNEFQSMIRDMRQNKLSPWNIQERISEIQSGIELNEEETFFLARMLFPHVDAADYVELVTTTHGQEARLNLVYQTECRDGQLYRIRPPFLPKEIAQFHSILSESALSGTFTAEHEFLFAFNSRNRLVGGLYWKNMEKDRIHLEWVAVRQKYQKIALSKRLMADFYKRMKHRGIQAITVGFYVEKFFFRQGFKIDKRYGGLVKKL